MCRPPALLQVHQGLMSAATFVHCNTADALAQASAQHPGWPLLVTGHSLGGGCAALATLLLQLPGGARGGTWRWCGGAGHGVAGRGTVVHCTASPFAPIS
jgi:hypothetical protein